MILEPKQRRLTEQNWKHYFFQTLFYTHISKLINKKWWWGDGGGAFCSSQTCWNGIPALIEDKPKAWKSMQMSVSCVVSPCGVSVNKARETEQSTAPVFECKRVATVISRYQILMWEKWIRTGDCFSNSLCVTVARLTLDLQPSQCWKVLLTISWKCHIGVNYFLTPFTKGPNWSC